MMLLGKSIWSFSRAARARLLDWLLIRHTSHYTKRRGGFAHADAHALSQRRRLLVELLEERRDLVRRNALQEREHHRLAALHELLGPEADAGEHGEAAVVELDDLFP